MIMTVESTTNLGDIVICKPSAYLGRKVEQSFKILTKPRFVKVIDGCADYSHYEAEVQEI